MHLNIPFCKLNICVVFLEDQIYETEIRIAINSQQHVSSKHLICAKIDRLTLYVDGNDRFWNTGCLKC